jgi:hypothetical protein
MKQALTRAPPPKKVFRSDPPYGSSLVSTAIHAHALASVSVHGHLRGAKNEAAIVRSFVRSSMPVRCGSVHGSRMTERCSSKVTWCVETPSFSCPSTLRRTAFDCRLSANGTAAVAHRSPDELRTIRTVTLGPLKCVWIAVDARCIRTTLKKFFGRGVRAPVGLALRSSGGKRDSPTSPQARSKNLLGEKRQKCPRSPRTCPRCLRYAQRARAGPSGLQGQRAAHVPRGPFRACGTTLRSVTERLSLFNT